MKPIYMTVALIALVGCSSAPQVVNTQQQKIDETVRIVDESPPWYKTPPTEDGQLIGIGTATSSDLQLAIDKASLQARRQVAEKIAGKLSYKTSDHIKEGKGVSSEFQRTIQETALETSVAGYVVKEQKIIPSATGFRVWVLLASPAEQQASDPVSPKEEFEAKKSYQDLEADIERNRGTPEPSEIPAVPRPKVIARPL